MRGAASYHEGDPAGSGHKRHNNITVFPKCTLPMGMAYLQMAKWACHNCI